jgi:hypothetical protein
MEKQIRHVHVRRFVAPRAAVVAGIDALWGGGPLDAVPRAMHGWKRSPSGGRSFEVGTRFGHGPFSFCVEHWDGHILRARVETKGFRGFHGFTLENEGEHVVLTHDLDARLTLPSWIVWQLFIARSHDWAVEAVFDGMHELLRDEQPARVSREPPLGMRALAAARQILVRGVRRRRYAT